ncbi:serine hydrolase domain-containing protein [Ekhidna sp.]|uniref:serine hydrolase domain-containing protein n=1 Tax=Ekhidna sp. TaxID=2608089 RepID=UPI003C7E7390
MKKFVSLIIGIVLNTSLFAQNNHEMVIKTIDQLLEKELEKENVHNVLLSIYAPANDFEWHAAKGNFKDGREVTVEHPFYTASVGKTFTATAIGMLVDQGKIQFDDPIAEYLPVEIMHGLHVLDGVDYGDSIKISHLLQHTSGLPDYFERTTSDDSPSMFDLIMTEPDRFWKPEEMISFSKAHFKPSFAPGEDYYYTDTEYVLLGMIIEEVSGIVLNEFLTKYIFNPLEMNHTYLNQRSEPLKPTNAITEMYAGDYEISTLRSLTADWAGGAVVSTGKDLIAFTEALMCGELLSEKTRNEMQQWTDETLGMQYGYGLRKINFSELQPTLPKWVVIGHSGMNGTSMYYCPDLNVYLAGTLNQLEASKEAVMLMLEVLVQCQKL